MKPWVEEVLQEWADAVRSGPTETVVVAPGGRHGVVLCGGAREWDSPATANGRQSHRIDNGAPPQGYCVKGLTGQNARTNTIMHALHHFDPRVSMTLRTELGLTEIDRNAVVADKAKHLGVYLDGKPWNPPIYSARKTQGLQLVEFALMTTSRVRFH